MNVNSKLRILLSLIFVSLFFACTKQKIIDTGIASPYHEGTIMNYLRGDDYNWALTVQMIERAGMTDIFEGRVNEYKEITFLGFTSHSISRHLFKNKLESVEQLSVEFCKETVLKHIIKGKILKEDIPFRERQYFVFAPEQKKENYLELNTEKGDIIRAYLDKTDYAGVPDAGPVIMFLYSMTGKEWIPLAAPNMQPQNGVVHSLGYNYILNNF